MGLGGILRAVGGLLGGGGSGGKKYSYSKSPQLEAFFKQYENEINALKPLDDPYLSNAGKWSNNVMADDYQAMTPEYMQQQYDAQSNDVINNVFKPNENRVAARMAIQQPGVVGSTYGNRKWQENVVSPENTALANLKNQIYQNNWNATREDRTRATALMPTLSSLYTENQQYPMNQKMQWLQALLSENATRNGINSNMAGLNAQTAAANAQSTGGMLGGLFSAISSFFRG